MNSLTTTVVRIAFSSFLFGFLCTGSTGFAAEPGVALELPKGQKKLVFRVQVLDEDDNPVAGATVTPWALRFDQSHGGWQKNDTAAGFGPESVKSDENGMADVVYPKYRMPTTKSKTQSVSLHVDHFEFAYISSLHVDVPVGGGEPYKVTLREGARLVVRPLIRNKPADVKDIRVLWSDGRSWTKESAPRPTKDGRLEIPPMSRGANTVMLVKIEGDRATRFSRITDVVLDEEEALEIDVSLEKARRISGMLSDNVPRPIVNGRVKVQTLPPTSGNHERVSWFTWAPIEPDGSFTIDDWPAHEKIQLTAICDGFIAKTGSPPREVENPNNAFRRPQVFPPSTAAIQVEMEPMVSCTVNVIDDDDMPIAGVYIGTNPNVGWWNGGSQIYCDPLVKSVRVLKKRNYFESADKDKDPPPFRGITNAKGSVTFHLPVGNERVSAFSAAFKMSPVVTSRGGKRIELAAGEDVELTLKLRPEKNSLLKDWDNLAAIVFGPSKSDGRRILCLPEIGKKQQSFITTFRDAKNQKDPKLLTEWYELVSEEFENVEDHENAEKWRKKAKELTAAK